MNMENYTPVSGTFLIDLDLDFENQKILVFGTDEQSPGKLLYTGITFLMNQLKWILRIIPVLYSRIFSTPEIL